MREPRALEAPAGPAPGEGGAARTERWLPAIALILTVAPLAVSALHTTLSHGSGYHPAGDMALTELLTRDVGSGDPPLIGPFSRDGWHHPGPTAFYVFALPYRLLGSTSTAMDVAALLVNGLSVAAMAWLARRRGGTPLVLVTLVGCALVMRSLGPDQLRLPWNPFVTVMPYGVLLFLTWSLLCRDRWALPAAVVVTTYLVQAHIGYVALALPLLAFGSVWLLLGTLAERRRSAGTGSGDDAGRPRLAAPVLAAVASAVVLWAAPVIEQLTHDPGNMHIAFRWFRTGGTTEEPVRGVEAGWRLVSAQHSLLPEWLVGSRGVTTNAEPPYLYDPVVPALLLVFGIALLLLRRSLPPGSRRLVVTWLVASTVAIVATSRTIGPIYRYRIGWASVLAMFIAVGLVWVVWCAITRSPTPVGSRAFHVGAIGALVVLAVVSSSAHVRAGVPQAELSRRVAQVVPEAVAALPAGDAPVLVDGRFGFLGFVFAPAIALQLERRDVEAVLPPGDTGAGPQRAYDGGALRAHLLVAPATHIPALEQRPELRMVAYDGSTTLEQLRRRVATGVAGDDEALAIFLQPVTADP